MIIVDLDDTILDTRSTLRSVKFRDAGMIVSFEVASYLLDRAHEHCSGREIIGDAVAAFDLDEESADAMNAEYYENHPDDVRIPLIEGAREALEAMRSAGERIVCVTTGIEEQQRAKIDGAHIAHLFDDVIVVSDGPDKQLVYADLLVADPQEDPSSFIAIGDKLTDVEPARDLGMGAVLFGPPIDRWSGENASNWAQVRELVDARFRNPR